MPNGAQIADKSSDETAMAVVRHVELIKEGALPAFQITRSHKLWGDPDPFLGQVRRHVLH